MTMEKIFDGQITQRQVALEGAHSNSSFVAEFALGDSDSGHRRGYLYAFAQIGGLNAEVARIALISGRTLAFSPPVEFGAVSLRVQILPTEPIPQSLRLWRVEGTDGVLGADVSPSAGGSGELKEALVDWEPWGDDDDFSSLSVGQGRAVFVPTGTSKKWRAGAIGRQAVSQYFEFSMGLGQAFCGLGALPMTPFGTRVGWWSVPYSWSVESSSEIRSFWLPGADPYNYQSIEKVPVQWSPLDKLRLAISAERISYQVQPYGEASFSEVYSNSRQESGSLYPIVVLGPEAFVFNAKTY